LPRPHSTHTHTHQPTTLKCVCEREWKWINEQKTLASFTHTHTHTDRVTQTDRQQFFNVEISWKANESLQWWCRWNEENTFELCHQCHHTLLLSNFHAAKHWASSGFCACQQRKDVALRAFHSWAPPSLWMFPLPPLFPSSPPPNGSAERYTSQDGRHPPLTKPKYPFSKNSQSTDFDLFSSVFSRGKNGQRNEWRQY
jgi:hypothetical protein